MVVLQVSAPFGPQIPVRHTHPFIPPSISVAVRHCKVEGREQTESREVGATSCCGFC